MTQGIRPSQFVTTYGPGAILETKNGPVIIPTSDMGLFKDGKLQPGDFAVDTTVEDLISEMKGIPIGIFRVPTNAELNLKTGSYAYRTKEFPRWHLCLQQGLHRGKLANSMSGNVPPHQLERMDVLHTGDHCPVCTHASGGKNAIRFVSVCRNGHLDDVDWPRILHKGRCEKNPKNAYIVWIRTGGMLRDIRLVCPFCKQWENFGNCFYREWDCSGRKPEREDVGSKPYRPLSCKKKSRIMQRQAANIRIPVVETYLSIHQKYTKLDNLARAANIKVAASMASRMPGGLASDTNFESFVGAMESSMIPRSTVAEFRRADREEVVRVTNDLQAEPPKNRTDMIIREYNVLTHASRYGAPPEQLHGGDPPSFEVCKQDVLTVKTRNGRSFTVVPVQTLETITVQFGYRRIVPSNESDDSHMQAGDSMPRVNDIGFMGNDNRTWYPGTPFRGEGLFLTLVGGGPDGLSDRSSTEWRKSAETSSDYPDHLFKDTEVAKNELDPRFVWWHTLSHLLIRSISEHAGYSAASIRERVYCNNVNGRALGGILLYATQPGTEGTLGGLVGLAHQVGALLDNSAARATVCSADPVCEQDGFSHRKVTGSCCYGCLLNSETSCEHSNMWLDRSIVKENPP